MEERRKKLSMAILIVTMLIITVSSITSSAIIYQIFTELKNTNTKEVSAYNSIDRVLDEELKMLEDDSNLDEEVVTEDDIVSEEIL